jgi:hypothetical protein
MQGTGAVIPFIHIEKGLRSDMKFKEKLVLRTTRHA